MSSDYENASPKDANFENIYQGIVELRPNIATPLDQEGLADLDQESCNLLVPKIRLCQSEKDFEDIYQGIVELRSDITQNL